ncbi:MAG TPA: FecR family protein [Steroidobacteraceae bacterium]|nr:FecR family protein [Steroidobacteraceae bacterium]
MSGGWRTDGARDEAPAMLEREQIALSLLRRAGRRNAPPPEMTARVYATVLDIWSEEVSRRRRSSRMLALKAAVVVLAVAAAAAFWHSGLAPEDVARVTRLTARVELTRGDDTQTLSTKFDVRSGDRLDVPPGSALVARRADGLSIRVRGPAYLVWDTAERLRLEHGRVYVDGGPKADDARAPFEVRTPLARIEHIGTRFVADSNPQRVRVAVREGHVRLTSSSGDALGIDGGQAAEAAVNGQISWVTPPARSEWEWVDALAPACGIEGRSLFDVLTDLTHEADLQLVFATPEIERRARELTLHGPALELPPRTAIDAVLATTDLDADLAEARVILHERMTGSS